MSEDIHLSWSKTSKALYPKLL